MINYCATQLKGRLQFTALCVQSMTGLWLTIVPLRWNADCISQLYVFNGWQKALSLINLPLFYLLLTDIFKIQNLSLCIGGWSQCSEWLVLSPHWSVDLWLIDWLANRISGIFCPFGRLALSLCLEFHCNTWNTSGWL